MNDIEVWKSYPEFEFIQGSNLGRVKTLDHWVTYKNGSKRLIKGHILPQQCDKYGYMYVVFKVNGKTVNLKVHRVIAMCFLSNPYSLPQVNHKDCDRTNNRVENLEWCDNSYNQKYRGKFGVSQTEAIGHPLFAINLKTLEVLRFRSQSEASRKLGANQAGIWSVITGRLNKHHGYWFTNADNNAVENVRAKFGDSIARKVE